MASMLKHESRWELISEERIASAQIGQFTVAGIPSWLAAGPGVPEEDGHARPSWLPEEPVRASILGIEDSCRGAASFFPEDSDFEGTNEADDVTVEGDCGGRRFGVVTQCTS